MHNLNIFHSHSEGTCSPGFVKTVKISGSTSAVKLNCHNISYESKIYILHLWQIIIFHYHTC